MSIPWAKIVPYLIKYVPKLIEAIIEEKTAKKMTVATKDGQTVRVVELKPPQK